MTDEEFKNYQNQVKSQLRPAVYAAGISILAALTAVVICVVFTIHTSNQAEQYARQQAQLICGLIKTLDEAYQTARPTTSTGRQVAADVHQLRVDLGC